MGMKSMMVCDLCGRPTSLTGDELTDVQIGVERTEVCSGCLKKIKTLMDRISHPKIRAEPREE